MTSRTFIACDPGANGGIAWSNRSGVKVIPMPGTRGELITTLRSILREEAELGCEGSPIAYVEKITGFIPGGGANQMFEFGKSVERALCCVEALGIELIEITPQAWQKKLNLGKSERVRATADMSAAQKKSIKDWNEKAKREWKMNLKLEAIMRFPDVRSITLKTCDALLILDAAIKIESEKLL